MFVPVKPMNSLCIGKYKNKTKTVLMLLNIYQRSNIVALMGQLLQWLVDMSLQYHSAESVSAITESLTDLYLGIYLWTEKK